MQTTEILQKYLPNYRGKVETITGSGSNRVYLRLTDEKSIIAVYGASVEENQAFIYLAKHFQSKGLPVPQLIGNLSEDGHFYLQEDLGNRSLFYALAVGRSQNGNYSSEEEELLHQTIACLPDIQFKGKEGLDAKRCYPQPRFDRMNVMFDLNYFKYCFLKATSIEFNEVTLEQDFVRLADKLLSDKEEVFMYRDFQARNVMLSADGSPRFIDFQGGRLGPLYYDLASFLWQAAARYPQSLRNRLIDTYLKEASKYVTLSKEQFNEHLQLFVLFRLMQVLGAYGYRGNFERKPHFLQSIPPAIQNMRDLLEKSPQLLNDCPYLQKVLEELCALPAYQPKEKEERTHLVVRIYSFSYKKGIPEDTSGNGGGYVFDCRSTHNPGRYTPYKELTGLDEPVIRFLEEDGEITTFLQHVYALAEAHVARYLERGFTDLMFSFGCTGGQHRSVYSAEHLAEHLHKMFGVEIKLCHREQGINRTLPRKQSENNLSKNKSDTFKP